MSKFVKFGEFEFRGQKLEIAKQLVIHLDNTPVDPDNPQKGFSSGEIRRRGKVADKIEAAVKAEQDYVELEDAEWEVLKEVVVDKTRYQVGDRALLAPANAVEAATSKKPKPKAKTAAEETPPEE
jgi:hypothetical protein